MSEAAQRLLLQVCPNDHPPFADICSYYEAAARSLGWRPRTVMLHRRATEPVPGFEYPGEGDFEAVVRTLLGEEAPVLTLCHRHEAYRAVITSRAVRGPVVAVAHEFGFFERRRRRLRRRWDALLRRPRVRFAGVSDAVVEELALDVDDPLLLPNGMDLPRADAARIPRPEARAALGLSDAEFCIGVVGRLHPKKNPQLALDGFAAAAGRMPRARLVFLGDGALRPELRQRAGDLRVSFTGFVADAPHLMPAFDLLVVPSGGREAFGMVVLEAMAAGVPVLCGPSPGPRFVMDELGRRFAPAAPDVLGEALVAAYVDWEAGVLGAHVRQARERVEQEFSVPAAARRLEALVNDLQRGAVRA